jgi:S-adenosylmethionine/arginine decarboxylase-like enzyme
MTELVPTSCITYMTMPEPETSGRTTPWGWHLVLNLYDCNLDRIMSAEVIRQFVFDLCELIEMRRFGEPTIVNFGEDPRVTGYSLVQLIETSNICAHFADDSRAAYMDIFSCKKFDPEVATAFCIETFGAEKASGKFISRD